ncbi:TPA: hypothetical protein HA246_00380 [Candidatus Woesearchaeota archaeon]|nr:hypothetical protein [Candidatus Woesearchaeota archaeon]
MAIPLFNYLLTSSVVFLGLPLGILIARIAEEELIQFKKFIAFFAKYLGYNYPKTRQIVAALLFFISSYNLTAFILIASTVFIYFTRIGILFYNEKYKDVKKIKPYAKNKLQNKNKLYLIVLKENVLFLVINLLLSLLSFIS